MSSRKTITSLCKENECEDIWALQSLFLYWLDCGHRSQVVSDFLSLRKKERNTLWRFFYHT